jgi:hypothetical protein
MVAWNYGSDSATRMMLVVTGCMGLNSNRIRRTGGHSAVLGKVTCRDIAISLNDQRQNELTHGFVNYPVNSNREADF